MSGGKQDKGSRGQLMMAKIESGDNTDGTNDGNEDKRDAKEGNGPWQTGHLMMANGKDGNRP